MCCNMNVHFQLIYVSFSFINLNIKVFLLTFRLINIFFIISIASKSVRFNFSTISFSNSYSWVLKSSFHSYSSFDFDQSLYEYDVFNLLKACWIVIFIFCVLVSILFNTVSFKTFYNSLTFSIEKYSLSMLTSKIFMSNSFSWISVLSETLINVLIYRRFFLFFNR